MRNGKEGRERVGEREREKRERYRERERERERKKKKKRVRYGPRDIGGVRSGEL